MMTQENKNDVNRFPGGFLRFQIIRCSVVPLRKGQAQSNTRKPRAGSPGGLLEALEILRWPTQYDY